MCVSVCACVSVSVCARVVVCARTGMSVYTHVRACMCACMHVRQGRVQGGCKCKGGRGGGKTLTGFYS